jgi:hypothetical protein
MRSSAQLLLCALAACGASSQLVPASFAPQFDCASARLAPSPGGYRLEGCGQIAFFHCFRSTDDRSSGGRRVEYSIQYPTVFWTPQHAPAGDQFVATREGVDQSTKSANCALESQREMSEPEKAEELARLRPSDAVERAMGASRSASVRAKATFTGGRVELLSAEDATHVLLSVQGKRPVELDDTCRITAIVEGSPLKVEAVRQRSAHELQLLLRAEELRGLEQSSRFFGSVCGLRFDLDARARRTLAKYELAQHSI